MLTLGVYPIYGGTNSMTTVNVFIEPMHLTNVFVLISK